MIEALKPDIDPKLKAIAEKLAEALKQADLAYRFAPNSYTFSALAAIHAAIKACRTEEEVA
jgi:hypothetical protein